MEFLKALLLSLGEIEEPVATRYRLGLIVHGLYFKKRYKGERVEGLPKGLVNSSHLDLHIREMENTGILQPHPDFPTWAFRLFGRKDENAEDVACSVDPFCYVSHLSAMEYHGLTDRLPAKLFLSSPAPKRWKEEAADRMAKDLGDALSDYKDASLPPLMRMNMTKIGRHEVHCFNSIHWGNYRNVRGRPLRVATLGRTFLDMLRNPELCGGMRHVLQVYEEHAAPYLTLITDEIDRHGTPIDKVRAGYILEERMKIENPVVESWAALAQRGGSRKLDASSEYFPEWSAKWCLSLNLPG